MKVGELVAVWPEEYPRPADTTNDNHVYMVRGFAEDFAGRELDQVTVRELKHWCLANLGAARYVRAMFNDAYRDDLVSVDLFEGINLPPPGSAPIDYPSLLELEVLIKMAHKSGHPWLSAAISFAAFTGLRQGEQCALLAPPSQGIGNPVYFNSERPEEWVRGEVRWQRRKDGRLVVPKTKGSLRTFAIFRQASWSVEEALKARKCSSAFLFPTRPALDHEWRWLRRETGLHFRWHSLRHYCATWLLDSGAKLEDVAVQLGCSVKTIEDHYGHPDDELALQRLEGLFS